MPNRLALSSSPYLRQHAENPVEWHEWGPEALARAATEDKPILLSIGYAACHWCHVMAHESFEHAETARLMNQLFVNIKVDREERPDLDGIYMQAVQAMTGHGGWPMTMFLTPKGEPFYGGTYYPLDDRPGLPSFRRVLLSVSEAWATNRAGIAKTVGALAELYENAAAPLRASGPLTTALLDQAFTGIAREHDVVHGGFGGAPKFPPSMSLAFLLAHHARTGDALALEIVTRTWDAMARGGLHDQVGGGWHRYTVDQRWLVPHFEKMLYDNAQLVRLGAHLYQATGDARVRAVTERALDWVAREMTSADGAWWSSLDADSEGHEGKFYVWSLDEFRAVTGDDAALLERAWGVTRAGNFEGMNILHHPRPLPELVRELGVGTDELDDALARARTALLAARTPRVRPGLDDKVVTGWNGLMLRGIAEAARAFGRPADVRAAQRAGAFLWSALVRDGRAVRVLPREGATPIPGFLEDHAALALGYLALYQLDFDPTWLAHAVALEATIARWFWDEEAGVWYDTAHDAERLITRPRDITDNAIPSGTSLAVELGLLVSEFAGASAPRARALRVLGGLAAPIQRYPGAFGHLLGAADLAVHGAVQLVLRGTRAEVAPFARAAARCFVPGLVACLLEDAADGTAASSHGALDPALVDGRARVDGGAAAYVCRHYACERPVTSPDALVAPLRAAPARVADGAATRATGHP
ncbi:MAG: thioredoxin domain-containing protein [Gemmatimonadetes bacterium]|nr:thioredoxin domain-containing protein [Gemmatimonadota bacterium]